MTVIQGKTVRGLKKRLDRLGKVDHLLHRAYSKLHEVVEGRFEKFDTVVRQAIADRHATIGVISAEIQELERL